MAGTGVRTTVGGIGYREISTRPGDLVGMQVNTFVMDKMIEGLNGEALVPILLEGFEVAFDQAKEEWPIWTGASNDSIKLWVSEVEPHSARVALSVGGIQLIRDSRNKSRKDYTPFIEFNGSPGGTPPGTIQRAVGDNVDQIREIIRERIYELLKGMAR